MAIIETDPADTVRFSPTCWNCTRRFEGLQKCTAYPNGIPGPLWSGEFDHVKPYPGDHGLLYEQMDIDPVVMWGLPDKGGE